MVQLLALTLQHSYHSANIQQKRGMGVTRLEPHSHDQSHEGFSLVTASVDARARANNNPAALRTILETMPWLV